MPGVGWVGSGDLFLSFGCRLGRDRAGVTLVARSFEEFLLHWFSGSFL